MTHAPAETPPPANAALRAAANNADWHAAVFRAHGLSSRTGDGVWWSSDPAPRFFSSVVTTAPEPDTEQHAAIDAVTAARPGGFAVKDSFAALDLGGRGFRLLFDAEWIWRDPQPPLPAGATGWHRITDAAILAAWEAALNWDAPADGAAYPPAALADPDLAFFARHEAGHIVAGAAANRSQTVVGLSNVFGPRGREGDTYAAAAALAAGLAPGLPVVGYESGAALDLARRAGFRTVGPLRVWATG